MAKYVYFFGGGKAEGKADMKNLLGGKGANLAEMANLGLPVPPGFTITTEVCTFYYANDKTYPKDLKAQVEAALIRIGKIAGKRFGDAADPLLVSVRSGARASMPGMMDTVLNLGLNDETVEAVANKSGDRRFAYDSYRRFITMYSDVVLHAEDDVRIHLDEAAIAVIGEAPVARALRERHHRHVVQAEIRHLGEVRALAAEQVLHLRLALGLAVAEDVDPLALA